MSCEKQSVAVLRESGYKLTPQRLMVLSVLRHARGHLTASDIFSKVQEVYPYVDISTIYRTLNVLKDLRLVNEINLGSEENTYEWVTAQRHHHLICRTCGQVTTLDHRYLEDLGTEILDDYGFRADIDHFAIFGVCAGCLASQTSN